MAKKLRPLNILSVIKADMTLTHEGAAAYSYKEKHPLIHLTFGMGSALFADDFYQTQREQVTNFTKALLGAHNVDARFPWQYAAWMRDPKKGKGNRIQGSLAVALLDGVLGEVKYTEEYIGKVLGHRPDDVTSFLLHYKSLYLGKPSLAAKRGVALALSNFDEYQLMKYTGAKRDLRLCDAVMMVREELEALGPKGRLALAAGRYLHAPTRKRDELLSDLPLTNARRALFKKHKAYAAESHFAGAVKESRVTWEQVFGHFGTSAKALEEINTKKKTNRVSKRNRAIWEALLAVPNLLPDMALMRNLRNFKAAGVESKLLNKVIAKRQFKGIWPHQVLAGYKAVPSARSKLETIFKRIATSLLPPGRHLGIGDASGSMNVPVGGLKASVTSMEVAFCLVGLLSESSGLGASFADGSWGHSRYLSMVKRKSKEGPLAFAMNSALRQGMGGTQVFGAVLQLILWLDEHKEVEPPDCLWFFSDMQFHPATGDIKKLPKNLQKTLKTLGHGKGKAPLELALELYRERFGHVDVVLWNLAANAQVPIPSGMKGVLLVSGFDTNTLKLVTKWRAGETGEGMKPPARTSAQSSVVESNEIILKEIRSF